jgi:low affinity Fe/Cu permease
MNERFNRYALAASDFVGSTGAFFAALALVAAWAVTGPLMSFSNTWQLIINSGTSILTFLIVFLIQHAQNRDTRSIRLKLDEIQGARPALVDLDRLSDDEIARLEEEFKRWRQRMDRGKP